MIKVLLIILGILVVLFCFFFLLAVPEPVILAFTLITGWVPAAIRLLKDVPFSATDITTFTLGCVLFVFGTHAFLRTLRPWRFRWSVSLIGIFTFVLLAIMTLVGSAHQLGWMLVSSEPLFEDGNSTRRELLELHNTARLVATSSHKNRLGVILDSALPDTHDGKRAWEKYHVLPLDGTNEHLAVLWHRDVRLQRRIGCVTITANGDVHRQPAEYVAGLLGSGHTYGTKAY